MFKKILTFSLMAIFVMSGCLSGINLAQASNDYSGEIIKADGLSTLYYVSDEGKRYVFPNEKIFKSWFPDFDDVVSVSYDELIAIPLTGNVFYRPGVILVKITTDPKIYAVSEKGLLRWIETEELARSLYGEHWNLLVDDLPDAFFTNYKLGTSISNESDYEPDQEVDDVESIDANHGLALGHAKRARTRKCAIVALGSSFIRECKASNSSDNKDENTDNQAPYIKSIKVYNEGDEGYIDEDDMIKITFNEAIDPKSINSELEEGDVINNIYDSDTGGVSISSAGLLTIQNIAEFDVGTVDSAEDFTVSLELSASGKVLTITITDGDSVEINTEDLDDAEQIGGTITDNEGNIMADDADLEDPDGTFGGDNSNNDDDENPYIESINVYDGGDEGYIDTGDVIKITFNEAIDPLSINDLMEENEEVTGIYYPETGSVSISSEGLVTIANIAKFVMGSVQEDEVEKYSVKLALSSNAKMLTITLISGDELEIIEEDFDDAEQTGGTIADINGNEMKDDYSIKDPSGTFGGENDSYRPYISSIKVYNNGEDGYIDQEDVVKITFSESVDPDTINTSLDYDDYVSNIDYTKTGGVSVSSSGIVTIKNMAQFDMGSVENSGNFTVKLELSSTGKILTITLTDGDNLEITDETFGEAMQIGDTVKDPNGNEMLDDLEVETLSGTFGGENYYSDDESSPYISSIQISNGGNANYIDTGDVIKITFNEAVDPDSINGSLEADNYITNVSYTMTGGVSVFAGGAVYVEGIAAFDIGTVSSAGNFTSKLALSASAKVLTITITGGSSIQVTDKNMANASQIGDVIEDSDGNPMNTDSSISKPSGSF